MSRQRFFLWLTLILNKLLDGENLFFLFEKIALKCVCCSGFRLGKSLWSRASSASTTVPKVIKETLWLILIFNFLLVGIIAWDDPTTQSIKSSASLLALALPSMSAEFILNPRAKVRRVSVDRVDFGVWMRDECDKGDGVGKCTRVRVLVLGANMDENEVTIEFDRLGVGVGVGGSVEHVLDSGARLVVEDEDEGEGEGEGEGKKKAKARLIFTSLGSGGWIFEL